MYKNTKGKKPSKNEIITLIINRINVEIHQHL